MEGGYSRMKPRFGLLFAGAFFRCLAYGGGLQKKEHGVATRFARKKWRLLAFTLALDVLV